MQGTKPPHTHTAHAYQRQGRRTGRWLECGSGWIDQGRDIAHVVMNRQPIGGYTGYIVLAPQGVKPEPPQAGPQRPGETGDEDETEA